MDEIQKTADEFSAKRQELEREKEKLERKQRKLLEAHYADAIPLNLLREEQDKIAEALLAIDHQLDLRDTQFDGVKSKLNKALELLVPSPR